MVVFAIAAFGCTLPHFFFGDELLRANNALYAGGSSNSLTEIMIENAAHEQMNTHIDQQKFNLCRVTDGSLNGTSDNCNILFLIL